MAIRFFVPGAVGSGIPQTKDAYYNRGGYIPIGTGIWRVLLGTVYVGLGNALGREGPIVHASSAIASRMGRFLFKDPERIPAMIPVGMIAGIGAAFNAPLFGSFTCDLQTKYCRLEFNFSFPSAPK